jgi:hypothetical protein
VTYAYWLANGIVSRVESVGAYYGRSEFRIRSLAEKAGEVRQRIFFTDRPPIDLPPLVLGPMAGPSQEFPRDLPEEAKDAGCWGMEIRSDVPLAVLHACMARRNGLSVEQGQGRLGSVQLAEPRLAKGWVFPESFRRMAIIHSVPFPFCQYEWYHILNPHPRPIQVLITLGDGSYRQDRTLEIPPERVWMLDDPHLHPRDCCWVRFEANLPILAQAERVIFSPEGEDLWGVVVASASPGAPVESRF